MKQVLNRIIKKVPFRIKRLFINLFEKNLNDRERLMLGRNDIFLSLKRLSAQGYKPSLVIDVGAHVGEWTLRVYSIFPQSSFIAIEALPDKADLLKKAFEGLPVKICNNLLGDANKKKVPFYAMETGSSVFEELTSFSRNVITLDMVTLDEIVQQEGLHNSILLKLDVQGFELEILKGASIVLKMVDVICMEISFLNYNEGAPLAHEAIGKMNELGFVAHDIAGFMRKSNDFGLIQSDFIFIKSTSPIRQKMNNMLKEFKIVSC